VEVLKSGKHAERLCVSWQAFAEHRDPILVDVAEKSAGFFYMDNESRIEAHKPRAGRISRHRIIREDNSAKPAQFSLQRAVPLHRLDPVRNHEVHPDGGADIEDALVNSAPMENVLRPALLVRGKFGLVFINN
jgi:hypothetical protein